LESAPQTARAAPSRGINEGAGLPYLRVPNRRPARPNAPLAIRAITFEDAGADLARLCGLADKSAAQPATLAFTVTDLKAIYGFYNAANQAIGALRELAKKATDGKLKPARQAAAAAARARPQPTAASCARPATAGCSSARPPSLSGTTCPFPRLMLVLIQL